MTAKQLKDYQKKMEKHEKKLNGLHLLQTIICKHVKENLKGVKQDDKNNN